MALVFGSADLLSGAAFALGIDSADDNKVDEVKREPVRDNPAPVASTDLPSGEHFPDGIKTPRLHGNLLIVPMGQTPNSRDVPGIARPVQFDQRNIERKDDRTWPFVVADGAIPDGYARTSAGSTEAIWADGTRTTAEFGFRLEGLGYPIGISWFRTPYSDAGDPLPIAAWEDSKNMTTIGEIAGHKAAFIHRRPGVKDISLQTVYIDDGPYVLVVEGYVDEFAKLIRVAESAIASLDARRKSR